MEISVPLPLDSDGFLRRQCPHCDGEFKWHHGPANEEAESAPAVLAYYCPLCGTPAELDRWYTHAQVDHLQGVATPALLRHADDLIQDAFKGLNSKFIRFESKGSIDVPGVPMALTELDDMMIVASPCHAYEPIKIAEESAGPIHCLICGDAFAV